MSDVPQRHGRREIFTTSLWLWGGLTLVVLCGNIVPYPYAGIAAYGTVAVMVILLVISLFRLQRDSAIHLCRCPHRSYRHRHC